MPVTSYTDYARLLKSTRAHALEHPAEIAGMDCWITVCRNGYAYRSIDKLINGKITTAVSHSPIHTEVWKPDVRGVVQQEIERFFSMDEIYAYSDDVLLLEPSPLSAAHWDATIAFTDVAIHRGGSAIRRQRMLFIGFTDLIHAEFSLSVDHAFIVNDNHVGTQLFEWREGAKSDFPTSFAQPEFRVKKPSGISPYKFWHVSTTR